MDEAERGPQSAFAWQVFSAFYQRTYGVNSTLARVSALRGVIEPQLARDS